MELQMDRLLLLSCRSILPNIIGHSSTESGLNNNELLMAHTHRHTQLTVIKVYSIPVNSLSSYYRYLLHHSSTILYDKTNVLNQEKSGMI